MTTNLQLGEFGAYHVKPASPGAGVVVLQEIFGVTAHIRSVADRWAALGFQAVAPALFDPVEKNVQLGESKDDLLKGRSYVERLGWDKALDGVRRSVGFLKAQGCPKVFVVGYCWGGAVAFRAAVHVSGVDAASCYYGRLIHPFRHEKTKVPTMFHYGEEDAHIPLGEVEEVRAAQPGNPVFIYRAGHGFNRAGSPDYDEPSAHLAEARTLELFR